MARIKEFFGKKKSAQAMVEFAIALPILLMLLYGILEAGRLLFLYSTVVSASRQAVRYGATTGEGTGGSPRYQDCKGIRAAANAVGYLGAFDTIALQYDTGPGTPQIAYCPNGVDSDSNLTTTKLQGNRTRLVVTVTKQFTPIVPKLVPFIQRNITASSARTILYSVPIVVEQPQQEWYKNPTITLIEMDDPDPSEIMQWVTVKVKVIGDTPIPTGQVDITGADTNCTITSLDGNGEGSCQVQFMTAGQKVITAFYKGDTNNLSSSDTEDHTVTLINTETTIISDLPDPSIKGNPFTVVVTVNGNGSVTPTGTVNISGGNGVNCTITLSNGAGSCVLSYNSLGFKTLTADYGGDSLNLPSSDTEPHEVLEGTPTPTSSPTVTPIPPTATATPIPTGTLSPTPIPSAVPSCTGITAPGGITISGTTMSVSITNGNPYAFTLVLNTITVTWNEDKGHKTGSDKTLKLQQVTVGGVSVWGPSTTNPGEATKTIPTTASLPPGTTTITFYFQQSYDIRDGTEQVVLNWLTPGCTTNPLTVK